MTLLVLQKEWSVGRFSLCMYIGKNGPSNQLN